jgi:hypothetical protein
VFLDVVDHYARGAGRMRVSLFGWVPVVNTTGSNVSKSALGHLMAESVLAPHAPVPPGRDVGSGRQQSHQSHP